MGNDSFRLTAPRMPLAGMRYIVAGLALTLMAIPSFARPAQQQQNSQGKVWTNQDIEGLRERAGISILGSEPGDDFLLPEPSPADQGAQQQKVWTNADLESLRNPDVLSIVPATEQTSPEAGPAASTTAPAEAAPAEAAPYDQFSDPRWYAEQAYTLRVELAQREAALDQYLGNIALAKDAITQPGVGLFSGDFGITLEAGVQNLESQVESVRIEIDELSETARRNGIPPGVLRG